MILRISGHDFHYECENLCRVFFPNEKTDIVYDGSGDDPVTVDTSFENGKIKVSAQVNGKSACTESSADYEGAELEIARQMYFLLTELTGYTPPWGVLTGVRPSKLMIRLMDEMGEEGAMRYFTEDLLVSREKAELARTVAHAESGVISASRPESFSLYVSIPFCPSRCSYCSFVSHSIANANAVKIFPKYLEKLAEEITETGLIASRAGLRLESIYFGGGTPGILEPSQLDMLQCRIEESFDLSNLREYTVEIGRPDTVTPEKLRMLKLHNVDRISINPQTFNQETLDAVGRKHTVQQAIDAYRLAKSYSFGCINMDLIAGLPGETAEIFGDSLDTAVMLSPENITVHTLALKRSSTLNYLGTDVADGREATKMLDYAYRRLTSSGYAPYYMYRQSKCVGNLENVGWCRGETKGLYNIYMMEECHTVLAVGAGGVTKLCEPGGTKVERIFNYKYPYEYISGFDVILDRKQSIPGFYEQYTGEDVT